MRTPVYVKMDSKEQVLLSEGICRHLGIVTYHEAVTPGRNRKENSVPGETEKVPEANGASTVDAVCQAEAGGERCVRSEVDWQWDGQSLDATDIIKVGDVDPQMETSKGKQHQVNLVRDGGGEDEESRKRVLVSLLEEGLLDTLLSEKEQLIALLEKHHEVFSLMEGERGETDLTQIHIDTGDAIPKKDSICREAGDCDMMQRYRAIQPSSSPEKRTAHCGFVWTTAISTQ